MAEKVNMPSQKKEKKKKRKKKLPSDFYDYNLLACTILLVSFGLIMLYSASAYEAASTFKGNDMYYFTHQAGLSAIVLVGIVILSKFVDYHSVWFQRIAALVYWGSLLLMAAVRFTPLGYEAYGARRWLRIVGVSLQPAEIGKLGLILYLPYIILKMGKNMRTIRAKAIVLGLGVLQALAAWILTDNLSTAIILGLIACVILFLADPEVKFYARVIPGAAVIGVFAIIILKNNLQIFERIGGDFRSNRIYEWLSGGSYQILQGLYAIGSGGFLGKGLGNSTQKITTIPEAQNDMIFSIICEELGIFGALLVLLLFGYLLYRLFVVAQNAPDAYGMLMVSGVFAHISIQVILNLCVVLKLMPATGITLPFISYGGTSVLFILTEIGIALCVSRFIVFQDGKSGEGGTGGRTVKVEKSIDKCRNNRYTFFERNTGCRVEAERSRTMLEKIKEILVEQLNCDADSINEDTSFKDDLGADSLDLYEMVMALEDEYGIEIDTDELTDLSTVGDFMEYLKQHGVEV